ncbi:hypothetical protein ACNAN0_11910 [Agrilactobacillus fermenti]|uniref:hypothetical protein n=1 Tax=Agrilactobacillus fermenti TaxID=2586909 RepID=UPI003A5C5A58
MKYLNAGFIAGIGILGIIGFVGSIIKLDSKRSAEKIFAGNMVCLFLGLLLTLWQLSYFTVFIATSSAFSMYL